MFVAAEVVIIKFLKVGHCCCPTIFVPLFLPGTPSLPPSLRTPQAQTGESKEQEEDDLQMAIAMSLNDK